MRLCKISDLAGGEILAKPIVMPGYIFLLSEGCQLQKEYIERLEELGIIEVYIKEEIDFEVERAIILRGRVEKTLRESVKKAIEKHTYCNSNELIELVDTTDKIIDNLLQEEELIERIYEIKERSFDLYEHSLSICSLAIVTALKMKLPQKNIHEMGVGCLLHDLGLRYITVDYVNRGLDEFSEAELIEYKKHPIYGYHAVRDASWISELSKRVILSHHEHIKGNGYPLKMRKKNIPIEVRIVDVCEAFDEMICGIGCRRSRSYHAIQYIRNNKNILFDGRVVDVFLGFIAVYPVGSYVLTNYGEVGIVIRQNKNHPDKPFIKIIYDNKGEIIQQDIVKDLLSSNDIFIEKVLES
ncbi:MAG: HD domain-containing protein [Lachnospiraceae bacterium]|nr:HD domain-containing protein [Lachnospiraceae bacterium]